ncbi:MAG: metallopeptidase TldD-related protein [Thermoanaerobaculaceae bacterium]
MEELADLAAILAKLRPPVEELYLWQELRLDWELKDGAVRSLASRLRQACSLRRDGSLLCRDGCRREDVALLLGLPTRKVPRFSWSPKITIPDPQVVSAQLAQEELRLTVAAAQVAVIRPDGVFTSARGPVFQAINGAGETFSWCGNQPPPHTRTAQGGRKLPPSGKLKVLLQPQPSAVLIHEVFGHPLEGDSFFSGHSPWAGKLGTRATAIPLTVQDNPTLLLPGSFLHDDEGEPARPKLLVEAGVLRTVLAHRSLARYFPVEPGNARRASPHQPPLPRISNLVAWVERGPQEPPLGEANLEVVRVRSGVFLPKEQSFLLSVSESYRLLRGTRAERLAPFYLKLPLGPSALQLVAGGGKSQVVAEPGWCSKSGQKLPVGASACWLLCVGVEVP